MRVLIISTNVVKWGGSEELWRRIAQRALEQGHEVMISVFMHRPLHDKILTLEQKGAKIHKRPFPSYYKYQRFTGRALAEVKLRLGLDQTELDWYSVKSFNPESVLISSGETFDYTISVDSFIIQHCIKRSIPFYLISQFNWEHDMDISMDFRQARKELTKKSSGHLFVSYRNFKNAEMQIASSITNARIINNPNKISLEEALPYSEGKPIKLAMMARYQTFIKGQDLLLQALSSPVFKSFDFELSLYGAEGIDGPHIEELIKHYGLEGKVMLKGGTDDVASVWRENQICILTSRAEGTSLALMEAMYCGRTAIVTNVGDSALWIQNNGYVAESNTVESLQKTLKEAFDNHENWKELGERCRDVILQNLRFNQDVEVLELLTKKRPITEVGESPEGYKAKLEKSRREVKIPNYTSHE